MKNTEKRLVRIRERRAAREAQLRALRKIRDDPNAAPGERLEAIKLLLELEQNGRSLPLYLPFKGFTTFYAIIQNRLKI